MISCDMTWYDVISYHIKRYDVIWYNMIWYCFAFPARILHDVLKTSLRTNCFFYNTTGMEWSVPNLYHTIHSTLERTRQLTRPFWYCQELYPKNSMVTHKNAKGANQQPALHCFFCWDEHHVYSLTFVVRISEGQSHRLCQGNAKLFLVFRWKQKRVAL